MLRNARASLFIALLLAGGLPGPGPRAQVQGPVQPAEDPATGIIVGQVVDAATGKPVSGAIVSYTGPPPPRPPVRTTFTPPARILTGPDGYFVFRGLRAGSYTISAQKLGYATGAFGRRRPDGPSSSFTLRSGERRSDVLIPVWKDGVITGTVVDELGEPAVNAAVRCWRRATSSGRWSGCGGGSTDDRGVYRLPGLVPGEFLIAAAGAELGWPRSSYAAGMPPPRMAFVSAPAGRGRDASADRRPFVFAPAFHPGVANPTAARVVPLSSGEERSGIDIQVQLAPAAFVRGTIVSTGEHAPILARIAPAGWDDAGLADSNSSIGAGGTFGFGPLPAGDYVLRATVMITRGGSPLPFPTETWAEVPVHVDGSADVEGLTVVMRRGLTISGSVEFDGGVARPSPEQLERLAVEIEAAGHSPVTMIPTPSTRKDRSGAFTSLGVSPGRYYVRVLGSPPGWMFESAMLNGRDVSITPLELTTEDVHGIVLTFTDRWTSLSGSVTAATGSEDDGALVLAFASDRELWKEVGLNPRRIRSARTNASGHYSMPSMPVGDYFVIAIPDEQAAGWRDPAFLEILSRQAMHVTIMDGEHKVQNLQTQEVR